VNGQGPARAILAIVLAVVAAAAGAARADEMDGWCAQVKKASSVVICSDAELREQAIGRNKLFGAARAKLSPEAYKLMTEDQQRWIEASTARCGVALDGPPPALPIPQDVIDCFRRESGERTAYLPHLISRWIGNDIYQHASGTPWASIEAHYAWDTCTETAVDKFADQPEPAETVATAAVASCLSEKILLAQESIKDPIMQRVGATLGDMEQSIENSSRPSLLARVMAIRAARAKLRKDNPVAKPAIDYNRM
jgi:uncharacterized protein YecT (DUF1311 family)